MARGLNKVMLIGNLGADPEVRYGTSGNAIANIRLATAESWRDKESGEQQDRTEWHRVVFFNKLAEIVAQYLKKGGQVYIEGSIRTRKWTDKEGQEKYTTEIVASEMHMLGGKRDDSQPADESAPPARRESRPAARGQPDDVPPFDDEIPF